MIATTETTVQRVSWLPLVLVALTSLTTIINLTVLQTGIGTIVESLGVTVATVQLAIVAYAVVVAALTITGGRISSVVGPMPAQAIALGFYAAGMFLVAISQSGALLVSGQVLAGIGAAIAVPNDTAIIGMVYTGEQRKVAVAIEGGIAGVGATAGLLLGGFMISALGWRSPFIMLTVMALVTLALCLVVKVPHERGEVRIDSISVGMSAIGVLLLVGAVNQVGAWGFLVAKEDAPFDLFGISPVPIMIVASFAILLRFLNRQRRLKERGQTPLMDAEVLQSPTRRAALVLLLVASLVMGGVAFLLLLYTQVIRDYSAVDSAVFMLPFSLGTLIFALLADTMAERFSARRLLAASQIIGGLALLPLAWSVRNDWSGPILWISLLLCGAAIGIVFSLAGELMLGSTPPSLAGDVGSARGVAMFTGSALGTAISGALLLFALVTVADQMILDHPEWSLPESIVLDTTEIDFVSNDQLRAVLSASPHDLPPERVDSAVAINVEARLQALQISLCGLALVALASVISTRFLADEDEEEAPSSA